LTTASAHAHTAAKPQAASAALATARQQADKNLISPDNYFGCEKRNGS